MANHKVMHKKKVRDWRKEIINLMVDFCLPDDKISETIRYVGTRTTDMASQEKCYNVAWSHMISLL